MRNSYALRQKKEHLFLTNKGHFTATLSSQWSTYCCRSIQVFVSSTNEIKLLDNTLVREAVLTFVTFAKYEDNLYRKPQINAHPLKTTRRTNVSKTA